MNAWRGNSVVSPARRYNAPACITIRIDRFMSECRSLTNFVGNAVATIVVSRWEGVLNRDSLDAALMPEREVPALRV